MFRSGHKLTGATSPLRHHSMSLLSIAPLIASEFEPFGDVLQVQPSPTVMINQGNCARYSDVAKLDFSDGRAGISIFHAHPYRWFAGQDWQFDYEIRSWRSVTAPLTKCYCHPWLLGRAGLRLLYKLEDTIPRALGRFGAYPLILIDKPAAESASATLPRAA